MTYNESLIKQYGLRNIVHGLYVFLIVVFGAILFSEFIITIIARMHAEITLGDSTYYNLNDWYWLKQIVWIISMMATYYGITNYIEFVSNQKVSETEKKYERTISDSK